MARCFHISGKFETSAPNDPQMTLNTKSSKVPLIDMTATPESQISILLALRTAIFELQATFKKHKELSKVQNF